MEYEKGEDLCVKDKRSARKGTQAAGTAASEPRRGPKSCSSHFKGVTKHRRTGRWEAHIWGRAVNRGPGKQIYLGGFVTPEEAAEAHDLAALQLQGPNARTNFHISKYADWLATLHATPSEDNLPLQLRRAGMYKRCSDRAKQPLGSAAAPGQEGGPVTPLNADAKARISRASDSSQTMDIGVATLPWFEHEDSVNSQASAQARAGAPLAIRRPLPVRLGMPMTGDARTGAGNGAVQYSSTQSQYPQQVGSQQLQGQAPSNAQQFFPGFPGSSPAGPPGFLPPRMPPQLAPLGWRSFQALAEEQAAQAAARNAPMAFSSAPLSSLPMPAAVHPHLYQATSEGVAGHGNTAGLLAERQKHVLEFLTTEQVRWLDSSGVQLPENLQPSLSSAQQPAASTVAPPQAFRQEAAPIQGAVHDESPAAAAQQPSSVCAVSAASPGQPQQPLGQESQKAEAASQHPATQQALNLPDVLVAAPPPALSERPTAEEKAAAAVEERIRPEAPGAVVPDILAESVSQDVLKTSSVPGEKPQEGTEAGASRGPDSMEVDEVQKQSVEPEQAAVSSPPNSAKEASPQPAADTQGQSDTVLPARPKREASHEDQQIAEALLGLRAAK